MVIPDIFKYDLDNVSLTNWNVFATNKNEDLGSAEKIIIKLPLTCENEKTQNIKTKQELATWKREELMLIEWFQSEINLPDQPFQLSAGIQVENCEKFYASLEKDIGEGPRGPRALFGALQSDLKKLKKIIEEKN